MVRDSFVAETPCKVNLAKSEVGMKVLIVHAHHEPQSFCSSLSQRAKSELEAAGHEVIYSDLCQMGFDPVSDRRNFKTIKDSSYLKQQQEEIYASENNGFADDLESEIRKLEECDALIFSFPLWWFGLPGILKGWCDRVFVMGRVYGSGKLYEDGIGKSKKRALVICTVGGGPGAYDGWGLNPPMQSLLQPIQHGIFWFNGFLPLEPFIAWSPGRISEAERTDYLDKLAEQIQNLFVEEPYSLPLMADFQNFANDARQRFVVVIKHSKPVDDNYKKLIPKEKECVRQLTKEGFLLDLEMSSLADPNWTAFMRVRASNEDEVRNHLKRLPLLAYLSFEITRVEPLAPAPAVLASN